MSTTRLNLLLPTRSLADLERIRVATEQPDRSAVIRSALAVYDLLVTAQEEGAEVVLRRPEGDQRVLLVP